MLMHPQLKAFGDMTAWAEIGPALLAQSDNGYNVCVGSTPGKPILFDSYAIHPRRFNAEMNSDAAGRYQFMGKYWAYYKQQLSLPDFGPESQERWRLQLIRECGATQDIINGRIALAIDKCKSRWASFTGAGYGQPEKKLSDMLEAFRAAGGVISAG